MVSGGFADLGFPRCRLRFRVLIQLGARLVFGAAGAENLTGHCGEPVLPGGTRKDAGSNGAASLSSGPLVISSRKI